MRGQPKTGILLGCLSIMEKSKIQRRSSSGGFKGGGAEGTPAPAVPVKKLLSVGV